VFPLFGGTEEAQQVKFRRKTALIAPAVILAMTAAACGGSDNNSGGGGGSTDGGVTGGQMIYGFETAFPENLFPLISAGNSVSTAYAEIRVLPGPFRTYPDFTIKPDTEFVTGDPTSETVNGKQVVTYKINPAAVWSDGQPITAKDFEFTWRIQKSSDVATGGCPDVISTTGYDQITSVEPSDNDKTATVTFDKPFSDWKSLFTLYPQHVMDKGDAKANCAAIVKGWPTADGIPVSGGPFTLDKAGIDVNKKILTLARNDKYWGEKPKLDRIILQGIGNDPGVTTKALRNDEIQLAYPQPQLDLVKNIKDLEPAVTSKTSFGLSFEHLDFNTKDPQLGQLKIRQAIALALNRPEIVTKTVGQFDNRAQVLNNRYFVNNQPEYKDTSGGKYDKADVPGAKALIESLGYTLGSDGVYAKGSQKLSFELMTTQNNPLRENTIDVITSQLKDAGIQIKKYLNPDIFAGKEKPKSLEAGGFQIALFAWVSSPYISGNQSIYATPKGDNIGQNYSRAGNPAVDALFPQINASTDQAKSGELGNQVDTLLWGDMYTLPLYQKPTFIAYSSKYTGVVENATNAGPLWDSTKIAKKA
jgi:peptide/nickel transport system substrate-binding protein